MMARSLTADGSRRAGIYGRQSHASRKSINEQLDLGRADCESNGWGEPLVYADEVSASRYGTKPRGDWARILADIQGGALGLLWLWESSRGDRRAAEWLDFLELCAARGVLIHVHSHRRTYDPRVRRDWKVLAEDGIDNEDESRKMSERIKRGMAHSAASGKPHGQVPFGFVRQYDGRSRQLVRQAPDETERRTPDGRAWSPAGVVRQMYADARSGVSLNAIADGLNRMGVPTPRQLAAAERAAPKGPDHWSSTKWTTVVVRQILLSPGSIGKRVAGGAMIEAGGWEPLVDEETYYAVRNILKDPRRKTASPGKARYLLTCLAVCDVCGSRITHLGPDPAQYRRAAYRCSSRRVCAAIGRDAADAYVTAYVLGLLAEPGFLASLRAADTEGSDAAAALWGEVERRKAELAEWRAQLDDPDWRMSAEAFARRETVLLRALDEAEVRARQSATRAAVRVFADVVDAGNEALAEMLVKAWAGLSLAVQREVLRELVTVRVRPAGKGRGARKDKTQLAERLIIERVSA